MSWSLGEIRDLSKKAARGAGYPWGLAEEAAWAVHWASAQGLPGAEALVSALTVGEGHCPLRRGTRLADGGEPPDNLDLGLLRGTLLILPFAGALAPDGGSMRVQIGEVQASVWPGGAQIKAVPPLVAEVRLLGPSGPVEAGPLEYRVREIEPDALARLNVLAARTYAPASEQSRAAGAGAGLTDND